jgi:hypothetical protein
MEKSAKKSKKEIDDPDFEDNFWENLNLELEDDLDYVPDGI